MIFQGHLSQMISTLAKCYGNRRALMFKVGENDSWTSITWNAFAEEVEAIAKAFVSVVTRGETIAIFAPNLVEDLYISYGAYQAGVIVVPLFSSASSEEAEFVFNDAEIRVLFIGEQTQYDTVVALFSKIASLRKIVLLSSTIKKHPSDTFSINYNDFVHLGDHSSYKQQLEMRKNRASMHDLAEILYTSGTTGRSKGVMFTYAMYNAALQFNSINMKLTEHDVILDFLPFSHVFERAWVCLAFASGSTVVINREPHKIMDAIQEIHPTAMCTVPRFWEKVYASVIHDANKKGLRARAILNMALNVGKRYFVDHIGKGKQPTIGLNLQYQLADHLVLSRLRQKLGFTRCHVYPVAGAAISSSVEIFVHSCGIPMVAGYGLTEAMATISVDKVDGKFTVGSVGFVMRGLEIHFSDENEILVRGETITKGYYHNPEETKKTIDAEGWFHTGDAGYLKDGELYLTDRIKNLYKTSNGKYIAPQQIESILVVDRFIDQIMIIADRYKYVSALIVPDYKALKRYADNHGLKYSNREDLCSNVKIRNFLMDRINVLQRGLAEYEKVKRFVLLTRPFTLEREELTSTMKIRRRKIFDHNIRAIEKMYKTDFLLSE